MSRYQVPRLPRLISELTVPFTQAYRYNQWDGWFPVYRLYYSSTQWITGIDTGPDGKAWYVIQDEADKNLHYFVPAVQLRPFAPAEFSPLSPDVPLGKKRIEVNLTTQTLTCYENEAGLFQDPGLHRRARDNGHPHREFQHPGQTPLPQHEHHQPPGG